MSKDNNVRKYPGESGPRPDHAKLRKDEAIQRQHDYNALSIEEKIARLPIGGAKKQLAKLTALLSKRNNPVVEPSGAQAGETEEVIADKKRLRAKDRRHKEKKVE